MIVASLIVVATMVAQDVPPPPKPKDDGPSLEFTTTYVQDKLNSIDVAWISQSDALKKLLELGGSPASDSEAAHTYKISGAKADAQNCTLSFRAFDTIQYPRDAQATSETDYRFSIRDVGKLTAEPYADYLSRLGVGDEIRPTVYMLFIKMVPGKTAHIHDRTTVDGKVTQSDTERGEVWVYFLDEDLSQRVAKALVHAVELCGGGDKDPFK